MMRRMWRGWQIVACAALVVGMAAPAEAQLTIFPRQGLSFGTLRAGIAESVEPTDSPRRAELEIVGTGNITIDVEVPAAMVSAQGATLALEFTSGDGLVRWQKGNTEHSFVPGQPLSLRIPPGIGGVWVWIGGTARPTPAQAPGIYTGSITVRLLANGT
jgi:hypothetical protein